MSKNFDRLLVIGDSHSTPNVCVNPVESFWGLTANELKAKQIVNFSRPKFSLDSVCQVLIGEQKSFDFNKDFFLLGIPPLERITTFDNHADTPLVAHSYELPTWEMTTNNVLSHHGLVNMQYRELDKIMILINDRSWVETQALSKIFLITQWLDKNSANYLIVNLSKNLDRNNRWGPSEYVLDYCMQHPRCVLFEKSLYDVNLNINQPADYQQHGWFGHHGPAGNRLFFEQAIKPLLC